MEPSLASRALNTMPVNGSGIFCETQQGVGEPVLFLPNCPVLSVTVTVTELSVNVTKLSVVA